LFFPIRFGLLLNFLSFTWDPRSIFNYAYSSVFKDQGEPVVPGFVFPVSGEALSTSRLRGRQPLFFPHRRFSLSLDKAPLRLRFPTAASLASQLALRFGKFVSIEAGFLNRASRRRGAAT
jgi:hypothetical protein